LTARTTDDSISRGIAPLKDGDPDAARRPWEAYVQRLVEGARSKLRSLSTAARLSRTNAAQIRI
jgi:hypothetical protein